MLAFVGFVCPRLVGCGNTDAYHAVPWLFNVVHMLGPDTKVENEKLDAAHSACAQKACEVESHVHGAVFQVQCGRV